LVSKAKAQHGPIAGGKGLNGLGLPLVRPSGTGSPASALVGPLGTTPEEASHDNLTGQADVGSQPDLTGGPGQQHAGEASPSAYPTPNAGPQSGTPGGLFAAGAQDTQSQHQAVTALNAGHPGALAARPGPGITAGPGVVQAPVTSSPAPTAPLGATPITGPALSPAGAASSPATAPVSNDGGAGEASDVLHPGASASSLPDQISAALLPAARQADGSYQVNIRLQPEELGVVHVELHLEAGTVNVSLHAEGDATGDMLRQNLGHLRQQMAQSGLTTGNFDVSSGPGMGQGSTPGRSGDAELSEGLGFGDGSNEGTGPALSAAAASLSTAGNGQLDMRL